MTVWSMAKMFEAIRYCALVYGFGLYNRLRNEHRAPFMASVTYDVTKKFNSFTGRNHWGRRYPLLAKLNIINVGKSSFTFDTKLYDYYTGEQLIVAYMTFVYVDFKTRKPTPFPSWVDEVKKSLKYGGHVPARLSTPEIPGTAYTFTVRAFASDIDVNGHVNQSIFLKWCADAGANAALKGHYSNFTEDIGKYATKQIAVKYIGEGMQGDTFVVNTWQDEIDKTVLHFVLTREGKVVFVAKFSYFSNDLSSNL